MMIKYRSHEQESQIVSQSMIPPYRFTYDVLDDVDEGYCHLCLKYTQWQSYAKKLCKIDEKENKVVIDEGESDLDDIGMNYEIIKKCVEPNCTTYKTIKKDA